MDAAITSDSLSKVAAEKAIEALKAKGESELAARKAQDEKEAADLAKAEAIRSKEKTIKLLFAVKTEKDKAQNALAAKEVAEKDRNKMEIAKLLANKRVYEKSRDTALVNMVTEKLRVLGWDICSC